MPRGKFPAFLSSPKTWYYFVMFLFAALYYTIAVTNHYCFRSLIDYSMYNFAFWDYSHFHIGVVPLYKVFTNKPLTFMDDHFSLTLFYFIPVYWLFNWLTGTYTLMLIEVTFLLISGWCVYKLILFKTGDAWMAVLSLLYYFILQGRFSAFTDDFTIGAIASGLVIIFIYLFELRRFTAATIVFILALFSKEIVALWFIFILPVLMFGHRKEIRIVKISSLFILGSIVYFILMFTVFIPAIHKDGMSYNLFNFSVLGANPGAALVYIIHHPLNTFKLLFISFSKDPAFANSKLEFYLVYLISGGFVIFCRPQYIIWFIPNIMEKMLNDEPTRWGIELSYSIETVALLPIAVFFAIAALRNKHLRYFFSITACLLAGSVTVYEMNINHHVLPWYSTLKENICDPHFFKPDYNAKEIHEQLDLIPKDAIVSSSQSITSFLTQRKVVYQFPCVDNAQYIAAFTFKDWYELTDSAYHARLNSYINNPNWDVIARSDKFVLLKKQAERKGL